MANKNYISNETRQAETHTITVSGTPAAGDTVSLTINSKKVTYTAVTGDTTSTIASGLLSAITQSPEGEFRQFGGQGQGATANVITLVAQLPGRPVTATGSGSLTIAATGSTTVAQALVYANLSPADGSDVLNWQGGIVPAATDSMYFENATFPMLYNLTGYAALSFTALYVRPTFSGSGIGLPAFAPEGYREYRGGRLVMTACPILRVELPPGAGPSSFRFNTGAVASAVYVSGNGNPGNGNEQVDWIGTSGSSTVEVLNAGISVATGFGETALIDTIKAVGSAITLGSDVTVGVISMDSSSLVTRSNLPSVVMNNQSSVVIMEDATIGTMQLDSGTLVHMSSGNITSLYVGSGGVADFSQSRDPITITNVDVNEGGTLLDPYKRCTFTNSIGLPRTGGQLTGLVTIDLGTNLRINRSNY